MFRFGEKEEEVEQMSVQKKADANAKAMGQLGLDFGEIAAMEAPEDAVEALIAYLGNLFRCDRVYIFDRNLQGNYDCANEWCSEGIPKKKHLMQNLSPKTVHFYYEHFKRYGKLEVRNIEDLQERDARLYKLLKPQDLRSMLTGQMIYDDMDRGFIGLDNPDPEKFDQLVSMFEVINYFISIQKHKIEMRRKLNAATEADSQESDTANSLYNRVAEILPETPLAVAYFAVSLQGDERRDESDLQSRMLMNARRVLGSIFKSRNVYTVGENDFLVVYEENEDLDLINLNHFIETARRTLESVGIRVSIGAVKTESYEGNFFELVTQANVKMLHEKREYRSLQVSKYHLERPGVVFTGLVEIRQDLQRFRVIYSEKQEDLNFRGDVTETLTNMENEKIHPADRESFRRFWQEDVFNGLGDPDHSSGTVSRSFRYLKSQDVVSTIRVSVTAYRDIEDKLVYLCYTL